MKIATKRIEINNYWLGRFGRLEEDYPTCFVCGTDKKLERCHLIPRALGGSDDIDNLVLLCQVHHKQAPNLSISKDIMLKWIEEEAELYDHFFHMKKEDVKKSFTSLVKINQRIISLMGNDFSLQDLNEFLLYMHEKHSLMIDSHKQANIRTKILLFEYISEYKELEVDYLKYLLNKVKHFK